MNRRLSTTLLITLLLLMALAVGVTAQDVTMDEGGTATFLSAEPDGVTLQAQSPTTMTVSVPVVDSSGADGEGESITVTLVMSMDTDLAVSLAPLPVEEETEETADVDASKAMTDTAEVESTEAVTDTAEDGSTETMTDTEDMVDAEDVDSETASEMASGMDSDMDSDMDAEKADHVHIQQQVPVYVEVMVPMADGEMVTVTVPVHVDVDLMVAFQQVMPEPEEEPLEEETTEEETTEEETAAETPEAPTGATTEEEDAGLAEPYITIARSRVNLRGGPGTNFPVVGTATQGEQFAVVGKNEAGNWFEFQRVDDSTAWIADFIVTLSGDVDDVPVSEDIPESSTAAAPAASTATGSTSSSTSTSYTSGLSGKLLYSVANMGADQWELWEYNFATGGSTKISDWRTEVAVSRDNSQIAYFAWPGDVGDQVGIYIMDSNLSNNRLLVYGGAYPSFNGGGDRLVVQGGQDIYVVNSDGEGLRRLTRGEYPAWSPVSNEIVHRACVGGGCGLWIIDANTGDPDAKRRLTEGGSDGQPAWSPNGQRIAYISQEDGNFEIYIINADGSGKVRLTNNPSSDGLPVWSPDGQWISFRSDRGGGWAIYAVRPDGTGLRKLVDANVLDRWFFEKMAWRR